MELENPTRTLHFRSHTPVQICQESHDKQRLSRKSAGQRQTVYNKFSVTCGLFRSDHTFTGSGCIPCILTIGGASPTPVSRQNGHAERLADLRQLPDSDRQLSFRQATAHGTSGCREFLAIAPAPGKDDEAGASACSRPDAPVSLPSLVTGILRKSFTIQETCNAESSAMESTLQHGE